MSKPDVKNDGLSARTGLISAPGQTDGDSIQNIEAETVSLPLMISAASKSAFAPDKKEACVVTPEVTPDCPNVDKEEMFLWPENNDLMLVTVPWCDTVPSHEYCHE